MLKSGTGLALAAALLFCAIARAGRIDGHVVSVSPGFSADLVISGGSPITVEIGQTVEGVTVLKADRSGAVVRVDGVTRTLPLGAYRAPAGGGGGGDSITLVADPS